MGHKKRSSSFTLVQCQRCGTCCSEPIVPVTDSDVRRISAYLKKPVRKLVKFVSPAEISYDPDADLWIHFRYGKRAMTLRKVQNRCRFLSDKGCAIYPARPLTCRTFPYDVVLQSPKSRNIESFELLSIVNCKATVSKKASLAEVVENTRRELREDRRYHRIIKKWNRRRAAGGTLDFLNFAGLE